ncbi:PPE family protein, SVP subgroup [Mycobacterium montefiorense]|uniref:PPE family protein, SVP subgroup n=1 Tax=Mycobacterium montefiorense TaxID=154654 RepID=UPI003557D568|nr:hypothetical protein [Mycobacterium montefiorense]
MGEVNVPVLAGWHDFSSVRVQCAGPGTSSALGALSVPPGWPMAGTEADPAAPPASPRSTTR